jgi:hypothetical protein
MMLVTVGLLAGGISSLAVASTIDRISERAALREFQQTHPALYGTDSGFRP